ncbi:hypothetical protein EJB05_20186 [Eragrostis curvula]|uniref:Uncharacterized protein n=1 Tax=Eragrostis curvula TaxID=38414 RepID=A0A5J9UXR9_9POAL|nr:hypothetical protein EJB05_20186 [Eragrostis curvula]
MKMQTLFAAFPCFQGRPRLLPTAEDQDYCRLLFTTFFTERSRSLSKEVGKRELLLDETLDAAAWDQTWSQPN